MSDEPERLKLSEGWLDRNIEAAQAASYEGLQARIRLLEQQLKTAREEERERCAKAVEPKYPRPCGCEHCDCNNYDDARDVAIWDEATSAAVAIRSLKD